MTASQELCVSQKQEPCTGHSPFPAPGKQLCHMAQICLEDQAGPLISALRSYCTPAVMEQRGAAAQYSSWMGKITNTGTRREQQCSRADAINTPEYPGNLSLMDLSKHQNRNTDMEEVPKLSLLSFAGFPCSKWVSGAFLLSLLFLTSEVFLNESGSRSTCWKLPWAGELSLAMEAGKFWWCQEGEKAFEMGNGVSCLCLQS